MSADKISKRELERAQRAGISPLEFMLFVMNDPDEPLSRRLDAAKSAAPFIHPKLSAVDNSHDFAAHEEALKELE